MYVSNRYMIQQVKQENRHVTCVHSSIFNASLQPATPQVQSDVKTKFGEYSELNVKVIEGMQRVWEGRERAGFRVVANVF